MIQSETQADLFRSLPEPEKTIVLIPHVVNNIGLWGSGFVVPLGDKHPKSRDKYLEAFNHDGLNLGTSQMVIADTGDVIVANMCAQQGVVSADNPHPLKYAALVHCMEFVAHWIATNKNWLQRSDKSFQIHAPRFGSDRAGGNWTFITALINEIWRDYDSYVYYL